MADEKDNIYIIIIKKNSLLKKIKKKHFRIKEKIILNLYEKINQFEK
jgi:hypothetical protein